MPVLTIRYPVAEGSDMGAALVEAARRFPGVHADATLLRNVVGEDAVALVVIVAPDMETLAAIETALLRGLQEGGA
jgi:hypothetical protein